MHDKINVCLLNDSFPPVIDGVANAVVNYGEIISTKNLGKATVVTPEYPGAVDGYPFDVPNNAHVTVNVRMKIMPAPLGFPTDLQIGRAHG